MLSRQVEDRRKGSGRYYEDHHIRPLSMGGTNNKSNRVLLTAREHFLAHRLLVKITSGRDKARMSYALLMMCRVNPNQKRSTSSHDYEVARLKVSKNCRGPNHPAFGSKRTPKQKKAISDRMKGAGNHRFSQAPWNEGLTTDTSEILRKAGQKIGRAHKGRSWPKGPDHRAAVSRALGGVPKSPEHRKALSNALKGRPRSKAAAQATGDALRGKLQPTCSCPHCGKAGGVPAMRRWHFDNCKERLV